VASTHEPPDGRGLARWETRAHAVVNTTRREFVYQWTAPRNPAVRLLLAPLFVVAVLVALLLFVLLFALAFAVAVLILIGARLGLLWRHGRRRG
jgi:hypothetical protein